MFCCLSAAGLGFRVILCPPGAGPSSRSAYRSLSLGPGPKGVVTLRTNEMRRVGCPLYPGERGTHTVEGFTNHCMTPFNRQSVPWLLEGHSGTRSPRRLTDLIETLRALMS